MNGGKNKMALALLIGLAAVIVTLLLLSDPSVQAATLTVNSTADSGPGTLRQCLQDAQAGDTITFDPGVFPPGSPATIALVTTTGRLPDINRGRITIDGSEAGVIIDGSQLDTDWYDGFRITSNNNTIKNLTVQNFPSDGVEIRNGSGNKIEHCVISGNDKRGVMVMGTLALYNTITQNSITGNDGSGIMTTSGGNAELPPPLIVSVIPDAYTITITGFAVPGVTVELFTDPGSEGANFIGRTTADSEGRFSLVVTEITLGDDNVTATATDASGNTSMFTCYPIPVPTLIWPLSSTTTPDGPLSSPFGPRLMASEGYRYDWHRGIDIPAPTGTVAYAVADGKVRCAGYKSCDYSDRVVQIEHEDGCYYCNYLHMTTTAVVTGQIVTQGMAVGTTGESASGFDHLHFEIRRGGYYQRNAINPFVYLPYGDTDDYAVKISQISVDPTNPTNPTTVWLTVFGPRDELDLNSFAVSVDGSRRVLDFNRLNRFQTNTNPEVLDNPYQDEICIMPARFNASSDVYRLDLAFHQMPGSPPYLLTAQATDLFLHTVVTKTLLASSELQLTPAIVTATLPSGRWVTHVHTLTNASLTTQHYTLTARSAQSWTVTIKPKVVTLVAGGSITFTTSISVPRKSYVVTDTMDCVVIEILPPKTYPPARPSYLPLVLMNWP